MENSSDLGLYGLGTMGRALALNLLDKGFSLAAWTRKPENRAAFEKEAGQAWPGLRVPDSLEGFVQSLARPRKILFILPPESVDEVMEGLFPLLEAGDILVDASATLQADSMRRFKAAAARGFRFVDLGIAGGAAEIRKGPVFMAGGEAGAWAELEPFLAAAAAKDGQEGPAAALLGPAGAGHFARMAQASLEYADLELIAETYHLMRSSIRLSPEEMRTVYSEWNKTEASSRLLGLTADILGVRQGDGLALIDLVLDSVGREDGGAWAAERIAEAGFSLGVPLGILGEAIAARNLSALKDERIVASALLGGPKAAATGERQIILENLRKALLAARLLALAQTFLLLGTASREYAWSLDLAELARIWGASTASGSALLEGLGKAYQREPGLKSPLLDSNLKAILDSGLPGLRKVAVRGAESGMPLPAFASALSFYDAFRSTWLPANLIQALRDGLGGPGYERIDKPRGEFFHSEWK